LIIAPYKYSYLHTYLQAGKIDDATRTEYHGRKQGTKTGGTDGDGHSARVLRVVRMRNKSIQSPSVGIHFRLSSSSSSSYSFLIRQHGP